MQDWDRFLAGFMGRHPEWFGGSWRERAAEPEPPKAPTAPPPPPPVDARPSHEDAEVVEADPDYGDAIE